MQDEHDRSAALLKLRGRAALDSLNLTQEDRDWAERMADELIAEWSRILSERLDKGISFRAIPAVFTYALAVMQEIHQQGTPPPPAHDTDEPSPAV